MSVELNCWKQCLIRRQFPARSPTIGRRPTFVGWPILLIWSGWPTCVFPRCEHLSKTRHGVFQAPVAAVPNSTSCEGSRKCGVLPLGNVFDSTPHKKSDKLEAVLSK